MKLNTLAIILGLCAYANLSACSEDTKTQAEAAKAETAKAETAKVETAKAETTDTAKAETAKTAYQDVQVPHNVPTIEFQKPQILQVHKEKKATGSKMTIHNNGDKDLVITKFTCEGFGYTELHNSRFIDGEREMYEIKEIVVPAHEKLALTPNRMHLMVFKPERDFKIGEYLKMELETNLGKIPVIVEIVPRRLK